MQTQQIGFTEWWGMSILDKLILRPALNVKVISGKGILPALFCSPTMELGVDIKDVCGAHEKCAPTPANYAQRQR